MSCITSVTITRGMNSNVKGGIPSIEIHFPPYWFLIGRRRRSAIRYIPGTRINVIKKANARPKIIVHDNGFQKTAESPPKNICGFRSVRSEEHTSELQSQSNLVCRLLLEKKKKN